MLGDLQHLTDGAQQCNIGVAQAALPFGDGGLGDVELLRKFALRHAELMAALLDVRAEGLFVFH